VIRETGRASGVDDPNQPSGTDGSQTRRWRKPDSNSWSHLERNGNGRAPAPTSIIWRARLRFVAVTLRVLGRDIIHSVTNPLDKLSYALHVYDGDFLAAEGKSRWDAETLAELPYNAPAVSPM
jgi:hypothetical protein